MAGECKFPGFYISVEEEFMEENLSQNIEQKEEKNIQKRWVGRGIYGKGDVPIRILDGLIVFSVVSIIALTVLFAVNGGYYVTFETYGGSVVEQQKLGHGDLVQLPENPVKPGYDFVNWVTSEDEFLAEEWNFSENKIEGDVTLYAVWKPAVITVKFDTNGGTLPVGEAYEKQVVFGEPYGTLPVPEKEGYVFDGWIYSQEIIKDSTTVFMTGEHLLTARWITE
jgi:uncharacterized repeat protein (TIGR02543 family)